MDRPTIARQVELELEGAWLGAKRIAEAMQDSIEQGRASSTSAGSQLIKSNVEGVADVIADWKASYKGKRGRKEISFTRLKEVDDTVIAFVALKALFNEVAGKHHECKLQLLARSVGRALEDEVRLSIFNDNKNLRRLYDKVMQSFDTQNEKHRRTVLINVLNKTGVEWTHWTDDERLNIGTRIVGFIADGADLIDIRTHKLRGSKHSESLVYLTESAVKILEDNTELFMQLSPRRFPTVVPPKPWDSLQGGGYYSDALPPVDLVKHASKPHRRKLAEANLQPTYSALNTLQDTAYRVNPYVLKMLRIAIDSGLTIGEHMPVAGVKSYPRKPKGYSEFSKDERREYAREIQSTQQHNREVTSQIAQLRLVRDVATKVEDFPAIFFPHNMDFRGRIYPIPAGLNPQGPDYAKALLSYADGVTMRTDEATAWLAIHGANVWGLDKELLDTRIDWVRHNEDLILSTAADPVSDTRWHEADKPWQFLAFAIEWAGHLTDGRSWVTTLPVAIDGSCNGLQHYAAMLRDVASAKATNLFPGENPEDIYQRVADKAVELLEEWVDSPPIEGWGDYAREWLRYGVSRKLAKNPVMTMPYGVTLFGIVSYLYDEVTRNARTGTAHPFGDDLGRATNVLANSLWDSMGSIVVAARVGMSWIQTAAGLLAMEGKPIEWTTPTGFPVVQHYRKTDRRRVKCRLGGNLVYHSVRYDLDETDEDKQVTGSAPNFVHSLDSSHLVMLVNEASRAGIPSLTAVHDSYGTAAPYMDELNDIVRDQFVRLYEDHNPLMDLWRYAMSEVGPDIQTPPPMGDFEIADIRQSDYAFA